MSYHGPTDVFLLVGGKNLTGDTFNLEDSVEEVTEEVRAFGVEFDDNRGVGIGKITLTAGGGIYDDRQVGMLAALQEQGATRKLVSYGISGSAIGAPVTMLDGAVIAKWKRVAARDGLTKANAEYVMYANDMRGVILHGLAAETADWDTEAESVDNLAASTDGAIADLHVPALTLDGHTGLTVVVLGSTDNITFAPIGTFTTVVAAGAAQRITIAGTIPQYLAVSGDFTGTGGSPDQASAVAYVALHRN